MPDTKSDTQLIEEPIPQQVVDEAALIEDRRRRREAIKAKHKGQATQLLVQALEVDKQPSLDSPKPLNKEISTPGSGKDSPTGLVVLDDKDLANSGNATADTAREDEPSAADYDPTMDMQEDRVRQDLRQHEEIPSGAYDETTTSRQDVLIPESSLKVNQQKTKAEFDMFADEDDIDMFAEAPTAATQPYEATKAVAVSKGKALDMSMLDDWDDPEGYYKVILGELLDNRYHVQSNLGKGMFSSVVRAVDQKFNKLVAIKIIRNNESMYFLIPRSFVESLT